MILSSRRRRICALAVVLLALLAACNRLVDLTPGDAFDNSDAANVPDGPPADADVDAGPDAAEADAAIDAI